jgi:hypothetical protein
MLNGMLQRQASEFQQIDDESLQALGTLVRGVMKPDANIRKRASLVVEAVKKGLADSHLFQKVGANHLCMAASIPVVFQGTALAVSKQVILDNSLHAAPIDALAHHDGGLDDIPVALPQEAQG